MKMVGGEGCGELQGSLVKFYGSARAYGGLSGQLAVHGQGAGCRRPVGRAAFSPRFAVNF